MIPSFQLGQFGRRIAQAAGGGGGPTDPDFSSVISLLHMNGTNGSTTFTDVTGKLWTATGATISTAQSKFGGASGIFSGASQFISEGSSGAFNYGTGNFTIEFFIYFSASTRQYVYDSNVVNESAIIITPSSGKIEVFGPASHIINTGSTPFSTGVWYHLALVRNGNVWTVYRDGTSYVSNGSDSRSWGATGTNSIRLGGSAAAGSVELNGHMDEVRISSIARYTANFTAPTAEFPDS